MLDLSMITHWYAAVKAHLQKNQQQRKPLFDAKTLGGCYGALQAALFIVGLVLILGGAVWFFVLICKLMVLALAVIGQTTQEFITLYHEQIPLVQLLLLVVLCYLVVRFLGRGWRVIVRPAFQPAPLRCLCPHSRVTDAYYPRFRAAYYKGTAYGY